MEARLHQKAAFVAQQLQDLFDRLRRDFAEQFARQGIFIVGSGSRGSGGITGGIRGVVVAGGSGRRRRRFTAFRSSAGAAVGGHSRAGILWDKKMQPIRDMRWSVNGPMRG